MSKRWCLFAWVLTQAVGFCFIVSMWATASALRSNNPNTSGLQALVFELVWVAFLVIATALYSLLILLRAKWRTTFTYGIMVGVFLIMMHIGLILGTRYANTDYPSQTAYQALAAFGILYFVFNFGLAILFILFRNVFLDASSEPPARDRVPSVSSSRPPPPSSGAPHSSGGGSAGAATVDIGHVDVGVSDSSEPVR